MDRYYNHPDNRGWMNLFRRWARSEIFRMVWGINKGLYGRDFIEFAETHLNLPESTVYEVKPVVNGLDTNTIKQFHGILDRNFTEKYSKWEDSLKNPKADKHKIYKMTNNIKIKDKSVLFVMGIALLTKEKIDTMKLEFIVVRDYLQRMGLGKQIFDEIVNDLNKEGKEITTLCTEIREDTPETIQSFNYCLGFRKKEVVGNVIVLEMKIV